MGRRFFWRFLSPDFFSSFLWEKCPEKSSRKIPGKILQNLHKRKSPTHFCRGAGPKKDLCTQYILLLKLGSSPASDFTSLEIEEAPCALCMTRPETKLKTFLLLVCDPSRHLKECLGAQAGKCPEECFLGEFLAHLVFRWRL